ncbi:MAG: VWA domain-containing protein [Bryobacteraceae bacterium]|jgi:VWFA-related protein
MLRSVFVLLFAGALLAQEPATNPPPAQEQGTIPTIAVVVQNVLAPVLVYDRDGNFVNGLQPDQFHLMDNDKEQNIHVDVAFQPISMVILIQANSAIEKMLPTINKIGNLIQPLILGTQGEAAVIAFDHRVRTLQEFTSDSDKITQAVRKIQPGSDSSHMIDATEQAIRMLQHRPQNRRRIILLIGETRDVGSEARGRETLINMQLSNIAFYAVDMSRLIEKLTAPPPMPRPDPLPPAMYPLPSNVPATPNTVMQTYGTQGDSAQFVPLLLEIYRDAKAIFKRNPVEIFAGGTGGSQFSYYRRNGLEEAIARIGEELHSEYLLSYSPNNKMEAGFHQISVYVSSPMARRIQVRPGYWRAPDNR